ncbi:prolyl oligopeptidase family serine peptidase [Candidatus Woesearchaeota archaeon]|nr:prolyl oligopeptidase family serine peptidase [Candidatus Woesearchaeota archaeon]
MKPHLIVCKTGPIVLNIWYRDALKQNAKGRFLIFCYGLPSHPYQHNPAKVEKLIDEGFVLVYPDYIGTYASEGVMKWERCVQTVHRTIAFLKGGRGVDIADGRVHRWSVKDIGLIGGSFGASVVMVAGASSRDVSNIIAVAGPTQWKNHSRIPQENAEPIEEIYGTIRKGWGHLWRIPSKKEWNRLAHDKADLNPIDYVSELRNKNLMLIHGKKDHVVAPLRSQELYDRVKGGHGKHRLILLDGYGHLGNDVVGDPKVLRRVLEFLK